MHGKALKSCAARSPRFVKNAFLSAGLSLVIPAIASAADPMKMFKSKDYGYTVQYPANWYKGSKRPDDPLDITSFPPSAAVHAVYIPQRGAEIMVAPVAAFHLRETPQTLDAWITTDTAHESIIAKRTFELRDARAGMNPIIEVRTDEDDPPLEALSWYFDFHGQLFKARLLYWQGNRNSDQACSDLEEDCSQPGAERMSPTGATSSPAPPPPSSLNNSPPSLHPAPLHNTPRAVTDPSGSAASPGYSAAPADQPARAAPPVLWKKP